MLKKELEALVKEQEKEIRKLKKKFERLGIPDYLQPFENFVQGYIPGQREIIARKVKEFALGFTAKVKRESVKELTAWKKERLYEREKMLKDEGCPHSKVRAVLAYEYNKAGLHQLGKGYENQIEPKIRDYWLGKLPPCPF